MVARQLRLDDVAVSSVISVVLLVAVTVIVAAVVATFALSIGESATGTAPQAAFDIEQETAYVNATGTHYAAFYVVNVTHTGGAEIDEDRLSVRVDGEQAWGVYAADDCGFSLDPNCDRATALWDGSGTVSAGSSVTVVHSDHPDISRDKGYSVFTNDGTDPVGGSTDVSENILVPQPRSDDTQYHIDLDVGDTVRVVWESERGDETAVLAEHEVTA